MADTTKVMAWVSFDDEMPEPERPIEVLTQSGTVEPLVYSSGMLFLPGKAMYIYYVPTHWRYP